MPEVFLNYKPRITFQGCLMVAPSGQLHSPLCQAIADHNSFLIIDPENFTGEGLAKAIAFTRKRMAVPDREDEFTYLDSMRRECFLNLYDLKKLLIAEKLQTAGKLSKDVPPLTEMRNTLGIQSAFAILKEKHPDFGANYGDQRELTDEHNKIWDTQRAEIDTALREHFYQSLGLESNQYPTDNTDPYRKFSDTMVSNKAANQDIIKSLLTQRLEQIEQNPEAFLDKTNAQMEQYRERWKHKISRVTSWLARHSGKLYATGIGAGLAQLAGAMTYTVSVPLGQQDMALSFNLLVSGGLTSVTGLGCSFLDGVDIRMQRQLKHSAIYSPKLKQHLAAEIEHTIGTLPERTRTLLAYYDPLFIIADSTQHIYGKVNQSPHEIRACYITSRHLIFIGRSNIRNANTLFEETTHLIQDAIWPRSKIEQFAKTFERDMSKKAARKFFKSYAYKHNFQSENYSPADVAAEVIVEMAHIEHTLMERKGYSISEARDKIAEAMPETGKLYMEYCKAEDTEYEKAKKFFTDDDSGVELNPGALSNNLAKLREREQQRGDKGINGVIS